MKAFPIPATVRTAAHSSVFVRMITLVGLLAIGGSPVRAGDTLPARLQSSAPCDSVSSSPFAEGMVLFQVSVNGGGSTANVLANDSFTVSFDYYIQVCPTTTQNFCQVVAGISTLSPALCILRNRVTCSGENGTLTFRMKAPAFPSQYLIAFDLMRTTTEPQCPTIWPNGPPGPDRYLACVTVTAGNLPFPVTGHADNVTGTSATLHGEVNPSGFPTTGRFVYGTTSGVYPDSVTAFESPVNGTTALAVSGAATGLIPNARYYYRTTAENVNGYNVAGERSFFTGPQFILGESLHSFGYLPLNGVKTDSITILNTGDVTLPITSVVPLSGHYLVSPLSGTVSPHDSMKFAVTYEPPSYGRSQSGIVFLHGAAGSPDTQLVTGAVPIGGVLGGWNVVSVPLNVSDPRPASLFPEAISAAFGFTSLYLAEDSLVNGKGYWLKFPSPDSIVVTGAIKTVDTTTLSVGWNIVGVPSFTVPIDSVTTTPPGIIAGNFFEYAAGYLGVALMRPGKGYWVKATQGGVLRMSGDLSAIPPASSPLRPAPEGYSELNVADARGEVRHLYVGAAVSSPEIEQPPAPPTGIFDARFAGDLLAARPGPEPGSFRHLEFRSARFPLTLTWPTAIDGLALVIDGRSVSLGVPGDVVVLEGEEVRLAQAGGGEQHGVAESYQVFRNYPNPFNPSTIISFTLAEGGEVELSVFNTLGERVVQLMDRVMGAGSHEAVFDGSFLPAGVYISRLVTEGRISTVKMMLLK